MARLPKASRVVEAALAAQKDTSIATLAQELLGAFGGPAHLAQVYKAEFLLAKEGSMARQRMLEGILRATSQASAQSKGQDRPIEQLPEEEIRAELLSLLAANLSVAQSSMTSSEHAQEDQETDSDDDGSA